MVENITSKAESNSYYRLHYFPTSGMAECEEETVDLSKLSKDELSRELLEAVRYGELENADIILQVHRIKVSQI